LLTGSTLAWFDWVLLALVPVVGVALAMVTARFTVLRALRRML
jgi:cell division transport system permease protein